MVSTKHMGEASNTDNDDSYVCRKDSQALSSLPNFHVANIESLIPSICGDKVVNRRQKEKMKFLREQCTEEKPYFLAFAETHLNDSVKDAEFEIEGYSHANSNRVQRIGGGVIIYIRNDLDYQNVISASDDMCSLVGVYKQIKFNCINGL